MTVKELTPDEAAEFEVLRVMSAQGKFSIPVGMALNEVYQIALERLQYQRKVILMDVAPILSTHGAQLYRHFLATDEVRDWTLGHKAMIEGRSATKQ